MNRLNCYYITEKELNAFFVLCGFQSKEKINKRVEKIMENELCTHGELKNEKYIKVTSQCRRNFV